MIKKVSATSIHALLLLIIICLCLQPVSSQKPAPLIQNTMMGIDTFIGNRIKASGMVGLAAALIVDKKVVWSKGYGFADKESGRPFTTNTIINLASIGKVFTGVCLMKAVEAGKLSLDEDINHYLPFQVRNPAFPDDKITLRHIATHTSGITDRTPVYDSTYFYGGDSPEPLEQFLQDYFLPQGRFYAKDNFLPHKPGTYREYSNIAAALAGYIIERVTGEQLNQYSRQHIFNPLGMKHTGWFLREIDVKNHSSHYDMQNDTLKKIPLYGLTTYPDGGVRSSVNELSRFFIAMLNNGEYNGKRILTRESVAEMTRYQFTPANKPANVNIQKLNSGLFWATKQGATRIGHGGTDPGVKTEMLSDLSKEVAVIIFTNTTLSDKNLFRFYVSVMDELFRRGSELKALHPHITGQ